MENRLHSRQIITLASPATGPKEAMPVERARLFIPRDPWPISSRLNVENTDGYCRVTARRYHARQLNVALWRRQIANRE
jgi:hypothetical protein